MKRNWMFCAIVFAVFAFGALPMWSQSVTLQGSVLYQGKPLPNVLVIFKDNNTSRTFKVKTNKNGEINMVGIVPGPYLVEIDNAAGQQLFKDNKLLTQGSDGAIHVTIQLDEGGSSGGAQSGQAKPGQAQPGQAGQPAQAGQPGEGTPEPKPILTKEQIEEIKKRNEKAVNANALIQKANTAMAAKNWQEAVDPLQQLITVDPTNWQYYSGLGDAQSALGQYDQAVDVYEKGIQAAESSTTVNPKDSSTDPVKKKTGEAKMLTQLGNAYLKLKKNPEAIAAFTKAASLDPNPGVAYFNLCATQYNSGNTEGALAACDKAITADPNKADAYFIKGSLLIASSKTDKDGKVIAPSGTAEALNKYLELSPTGPHAGDVKQMLEYIGSKIETTYKQKKGK
jgi:tetratricopeptide (TPR) repeat protein